MPLLALAAVGGYLVGSIPWAYLLVRWRSGADIRDEGSGNVGTLNSYVVSRSKGVAAAVLLLDLAKGIGATLLGGVILPGGISGPAVAGVLAVVGHNYPVWLRLRGGRGLAPAAGVMLGTAWGVVPAWLLLWGIGYAITRSINPASAFASGSAFIAAFTLPDRWIAPLFPGAPTLGIRLFAATVMVVIMARLLSELRIYIGEIRARRSRRGE